MWNLVKIDGKWYHLDCTWDDGYGDTYFYGYYNLTDKQIEKDHTWDPLPEIVCNTDYLEVLKTLASNPAIKNIMTEIENNR